MSTVSSCCLILCFFFLCYTSIVFIFFLFHIFFLMIRRPPRSTLDRSSAASDVYKRQFLAVRRQHRTQRAAHRAGHQLVAKPHLANFSSLNTVSYTHLRAHETVLDLVCRLLLEKKNKKKHTHNTHTTHTHTHIPDIKKRVEVEICTVI